MTEFRQQNSFLSVWHRRPAMFFWEKAPEPLCRPAFPAGLFPRQRISDFNEIGFGGFKEKT